MGKTDGLSDLLLGDPETFARDYTGYRAPGGLWGEDLREAFASEIRMSEGHASSTNVRGPREKLTRYRKCSFRVDPGNRTDC